MDLTYGVTGQESLLKKPENRQFSMKFLFALLCSHDECDQ